MKIGIVGGGVSGLAAAARLSANGHQVDLYEKGEQVGGRMNKSNKMDLRLIWVQLLS